MIRLAILVVILSSCKAKPARRDDAAVRAHDAGVTKPAPWPELARLPNIDPVRVITLPARPNVPRFTVGGPVMLGELAVVSSSQFGFIAVDVHRGQIAWTKPAGPYVAPPAIVDGNVILIGDCLTPPEIPERHTLLGCVRVVTASGADQAYVAIHNHAAAVAEFAGSAGQQRVWRTANSVVWRRGEHAVAIDLISGVATPAPADDPPLIVRYKHRTWEISRTDEGIIAARQPGDRGRAPKARDAWRTEHTYGPLIGAVYLPEQSPMVRASRATMHDGKPELLLFDMDATGSLHGQVSMSPVPGIGLIGHAISSVGDAALAVRLDKSLQRDFIAGYAANARLMWTYQLPQIPRPDPVGVAVTPDAVVVFHDGDTLTILPELSAPPTAPGAVRAPSENATP